MSTRVAVLEPRAVVAASDLSLARREARVRTAQAKAEREAARLDFAKTVLTQPAVQAIAGCVVVELLQHVSFGETPATGPSWSYNWWGGGTPLGIQFHPSKPAAPKALLSEQLGSAIEVGLIINLAGASTASLLKGVGGLLPALSTIAGAL